jgi:hypothetical protein
MLRDPRRTYFSSEEDENSPAPPHFKNDPWGDFDEVFDDEVPAGFGHVNSDKCLHHQCVLCQFTLLPACQSQRTAPAFLIPMMARINDIVSTSG